ncbi:hypothetical protein [Nocardia asiatica]|uniref:hypothetical protein n=1 Tax=Nocardia asiatica TaxID=209252 RepID=UPI002455B5A4|nr:hypothetical protein [Nocardia asiatica]
MGYEWLPSAISRLQGLGTDEVIAALLDARRRWVQRVETKSGAHGLAVWTRTPAGAPILVVLRPLEGWDHQITYAAPMTPQQQAAFEEWENNQ